MPGAPAYARGSIPRLVMDIMRDAPDRTMRRDSLLLAVARRRDTPAPAVSNSVAQALLRMVRRNHVARPARGVYQLLVEPVPDDFPNYNAWQESKGGEA